jgi:hypothetical protein
MNALSSMFRYMNRKSTEFLVVSLQRLPFYRGRFDKMAFGDPLLDSEATRKMRLPRTAYEADWPPMPMRRAKKQPE